MAKNSSKTYSSPTLRKKMKIKAKDEKNVAIDHSLLYEPLNLGIKNVQQILKFISNGTTEIKDIILNECNIVYECRVCQSLFRSLANFVVHKRVYCKEHCCEKMVLYDAKTTKLKENVLQMSDIDAVFKSTDKREESESSIEQSVSTYENDIDIESGTEENSILSLSSNIEDANIDNSHSVTNKRLRLENIVNDLSRKSNGMCPENHSSLTLIGENDNLPKTNDKMNGRNFDLECYSSTETTKLFNSVFPTNCDKINSKNVDFQTQNCTEKPLTKDTSFNCEDPKPSCSTNITQGKEVLCKTEVCSGIINCDIEESNIVNEAYMSEEDDDEVQLIYCKIVKKCLNKFDISPEIEQEIDKIADYEHVICAFCLFDNFETVIKLKKHIAEMHLNHKIYECSFCTFYSSTDKSLVDQHISISHGNGTRNSN